MTVCNFLSAIVTRTGNVLVEPMIDSHETLIALFNLRDDKPLDLFVRVEYTPPSVDGKPDYFAFDKYTLKVDESEVPAWFEEHRENVVMVLRRTLDKMLVTNERKVLIGGAWLIGDGAKVGQIVQGRVLAAHAGAYLAGANLAGANLAGANLAGAYLDGANIARANLAGANLDGAYLARANLARANLAGANLDGANLAGANLDGAYLAGANLAGANRPSAAPPGWKANEHGILGRDEPSKA